MPSNVFPLCLKLSQASIKFIFDAGTTLLRQVRPQVIYQTLIARPPSNLLHVRRSPFALQTDRSKTVRLDMHSHGKTALKQASGTDPLR